MDYQHNNIDENIIINNIILDDTKTNNKSNNLLIIIDNISQNTNWNNTYNIIKRWLIYYLNERIKTNSIELLTIGKTFPQLKTYSIKKEHVDICNIIYRIYNG